MASTIGFLGAGRMASAMIGCFLANGFAVKVWNRTPSKLDPLIEQGAVACTTPADAARDADAVISFMANDEGAKAVWLGENGALEAIKPGGFVIECSTLSHQFVLSLAHIAQEKGLRYLDAPVTAVPDQVARGETVFLIGAEDRDLADARPILDAVAAKIVHFGLPGTGTVYKLMNNLLGAVHIAAAAELVAVAKSAGLDPDTVAQTFLSGPLASGPACMTLPGMISNNHTEGRHFTTALRAKDARYALRLADDLALPLPVGAAASAVFDHATADGLGDLAQSAVIETLVRPQSDKAD
jgi:3-hydroxyisobutyrate dehydrogenase